MTEPPASVLVVDDESINRMLLSHYLERQGHRVATADNGVAALEALQAEPFDVVLLDIVMPELDGYETLRRIQADERLRRVPVIVVSALEDIESVVRCIEMGASDYLPKPFDPVLLRARINGCLTTKRLRDLERRYLEQERERVRGLFARFVPEAVVDEVLTHADEDLRLGGERRMATVLFCDLRGFTAFAEARPPEVVIDALNRYLSAMTDVILSWGGTLMSFMGDGIMAAFGVPIEQRDHADRALEAAREMTGEALPAFNAWLIREGIGDGFRMGVGVSSGVVMAGNVGSERRLDYTVIGDTANTAARLEALTKETPHMVLISDSTRTMLTTEGLGLIEVETRMLRGRRAPVLLWSIESGSGATTAESSSAHAH